MHIYLTKINIIYKLQSGFRQKFSIPEALINLSKNLIEALDEGNIDCESFIDLKTAFSTTDHDILSLKLNLYDFRGVSNICLGSHLSDRIEYKFLNGSVSNYAFHQESWVGISFICVFL